MSEATAPVKRPAPPNNELPWVFEALLFVAEEPLGLAALAQAAGVGEATARKALAQLAADYQARGLRVMEDGQKYQIVTAPEYAGYVDTLLGLAPGQKLSRAALEVLTIIAYRQPCSRAEVEAIRGTNSDKLVNTLEARGLVENSGTSEGAGRAKLYRTTMRFLEHFGIASPKDLPPLPIEEDEILTDPL